MEAVNLTRAHLRPRNGLFALLIVAGISASAWRSFDPLLAVWSKEEYSHAWFILPLALLVFLQRFRAIRAGSSGAPGLLLIPISLAMMLFSWATGSFTVAIYGALLGIVGFVWSSVGTASMKVLAAPLIYLFFMVPLPAAFYISASTEMQLWSSELGMMLISVFQVPASLEGNIIVLHSARLEVAEACSGLRYLFPLISFAFLISMLIEDKLWKKAVLVLSSIPVAIVMNASRIALIAVLLERFGIDTSSGTAHAFEGFAVFSLCTVVLLLEAWFLLGIGKAHGRFLASELFVLDRSAVQKVLSWPLPAASIGAGIILLAGSSLVAGLPVRDEIIPRRQPFALFPMEFKDWRGTPTTLDEASLDALAPTDYVLADYTNPKGGRPLNFYAAYYASQRAGIRTHSPQLCIPGGGWNIMRQSMFAIRLADGESLDVNRVLIERRGVKQIVYYWFEERGRHIATESTLKYYALRDALADNRTDGALVRIVVPIYDDEQAADSVATLFLGAMIPLLGEYVPGKIPG